MHVDMTSQNFKANLPIRIKANYKKNKNNTLLYNDVLQILRDCGAPASIHNDKIDITYVTDIVKRKLKELKIGYICLKN